LGIALVGFLVPFGGSSPGPLYTVVRGDSLSVIARREGRTIAELREWNGISGDLIEIGQVLTVGPEVESDPWTVFDLSGQWLASLREALAGPSAGTSGEGDEAAVVPENSVVVPRRSRRSAQGLRRSRARQSRDNRGERGAEDFSGPAGVPLAWPALRMPAAKSCLAADAGIEEGSFGRSQGLDADEISAATRAFQEQTLRCYQGRESAAGEVLVQLVVGCDGRVRRSQVTGDDTGTEGFADCVADVMRYASFPAHARDEVEFVVPMQFVADTGSP